MKQSIYKVKCEHPRLIYNPRLKQLMCCFDSLVYFSRHIRITAHDRSEFRLLDIPIHRLFHFPSLSVFYSSSNCIKDYDVVDALLDSCFFLDEETGATEPLYMVVSCGRCDACRSQKVYSYIQRCELAAASCDTPPVFVTLQYNDEHLPYHGVSVRHVQLFKKRFKRTVELMFGSSAAKLVKFFVVSEYGHENHRPHYHLVLFGLPPQLSNPEKALCNYTLYHIVMYCWREPVRKSNGLFVTFNEYRKFYPQIFKRPPHYDPYSYGYVNLQYSNKGKSPIAYTLKYQLKDNDYTKSHWYDYRVMHGTFVLCSVNLGVDFVQQSRNSLLDSVDGVFKYYDKFRGQMSECHLVGYFINKLFPPISKLVSSDVRKALLDLHFVADLSVSQCRFDKDICASLLASVMFYNSKFPFINPRQFQFDFSHSYAVVTDAFLMDLFLRSTSILDSVKSVDPRILSAALADRDRFLAKMSSVPPDVGGISHRFSKQIKVMQSKAQL